MLSTRSSKVDFGIALQASRTYRLSCVMLVGFFFWILLLTSAQRFSMGLRSGLCASQGSVRRFSVCEMPSRPLIDGGRCCPPGTSHPLAGRDFSLLGGDACRAS